MMDHSCKHFKNVQEINLLPLIEIFIEKKYKKWDTNIASQAKTSFVRISKYIDV